MTEKDKRVLQKLLKHCDKIITYNAQNQSLDDFVADEMVIEATVFNLLQIGELSKQQLSDQVKKIRPGIPWNAIYGLRNRMVHGYGDVDYTIVWDTVNDDIPELRGSLQELLKDEKVE